MSPPGPQALVRELLERLMRRQHVAGLQYLFSAGGQVLMEHSAGLAETLRSVPVTHATTFNLYSITKPCTAACALAHAQAGAFGLDDPVSAACGLDTLRAFGTVRETLLHRAGFPNPMPLRWIHLAQEDAGFDEAGFVAQRLKALEGMHPRRGRAAYSNLGYLAIGRALERASGLPFRRALQQTLLDRLAPLEGARLGFTLTDLHARGQMRRHGLLALALGWLVDRQRIVEGTSGRWQQLRLHHVDGSAYGGLMGNARGLAGFGHAALGLVEGLAPAVREALLAPAPGHGRPRTLAFFEGRLDGRRWLGHAGGGLGAYGEMRLYPAVGAVSVLLTNAPGLREHRWLDTLDAPWLAEHRAVAEA
mgnify:CR=1 FL=1